MELAGAAADVVALQAESRADAGGALAPRLGGAPPSAADGTLPLLHAALAASDAARREAERENARLRCELERAKQQLVALVEYARARTAAPRPAPRTADDGSGALATAGAASLPHDASAVSLAVVHVAPAQPFSSRRVLEAEDPNVAHAELRRRAKALGLGAAPLFRKHPDAAQPGLSLCAADEVQLAR